MKSAMQEHARIGYDILTSETEPDLVMFEMDGCVCEKCTIKRKLTRRSREHVSGFHAAKFDGFYVVRAMAGGHRFTGKQCCMRAW